MRKDLMSVVFLAMLFGTTMRARAQNASETATSTQIGSVQLEFATSNESYRDGEIKSNVSDLFSGAALNGITEALEIQAGLDFREQAIKENGRERANRLSGYSPLLIGLGYDLFPEKWILQQVTLIGDFSCHSLRVLISGRPTLKRL